MTGVGKNVHWATTRRFAFFVIGDALLLCSVLLVALVLRFEGDVPRSLLTTLHISIVVALGSKIPILYWKRLYSMNWSYVGLEDLVAVIQSITLGSLLFSAIILGLRSFDVLAGFPKGVLVIDFALSLLVIGGFRISRRTIRQMFKQTTVGPSVLLVGAGFAGEQLARAMLFLEDCDYVPIGFLDDDPVKHGTSVHRVPVLGPRSALPEIVKQKQVSHVFIAMPSAPARAVRETIDLARKVQVQDVRIIPSLDRIVEGRITLSDLREVQLEDLLGREVVSISETEVASYVQDKIILVTGAGGSIGSELCYQLLKFNPSRLIMLDRDESGLFQIHQGLASTSSVLDPVIGDVCDRVNMEWLLQNKQPSVIFHAAAYKHVELMERHPKEAVSTNVGGTLVMAQAACQAGIGKFVLISTDKAVNPTSLMGATKRVAEQVCVALNEETKTQFVTVRFGNVLGSRGSVVPIFQEQIRRGGPVTVRGPEVRRYFMAISEAVLLVLQAGAIGKGGEVFVLDMGDQVRIIDLAHELIRLSGFEADRDIPIIFTALAPGEKESEDILTGEEGTQATSHDKIYSTKITTHVPKEQIIQGASTLQSLAQQGTVESLVPLLQELVPTYIPSSLAVSVSGPRSTAFSGPTQGPTK
jgi:FlaA1/EpsC-like NDP-sugar epimerase